MRVHPVSPWVAVLALFAVACGSGSDSSQPSPTEPLAPTVSGLVVIGRNIPVSGGDALGTPPQGWASAAEGAAFDRAVAHADWRVTEMPDTRGVTSDDGRFQLSGLPPGRYTLELTKALAGNLVPVSMPFTVPVSGEATLVAELELGLLRTALRFTEDGHAVTEIQGPYGTRVVTRDGVITELGDPTRTYLDPDGDGRFERPGCDDCAAQMCTDSCEPVEIASLTITSLPAQVVLGRQTQAAAVATFSDGSTVDVTHLVEWRSADEAVATVDSWGRVSARAVGVTQVTASLGTLHATAVPLSVVERPALQRISVENAACSCGPVAALPAEGGAMPPPCLLANGERPDLLPVPMCTGVVQIGRTIPFRAIGAFADGSYEDLTAVAAWSVTPANAGQIEAGVFTALEAGTAQVSASLGGIVSDALEIRVVAEPTVVSLSIYSTAWDYTAFAGGPITEGGVPCFACDTTLSVLLGDTVGFRATAHYDTGEWRDVTATATWRSSAPEVAPVDGAGQVRAELAGKAGISATLDAVASNVVTIQVVDHATLESISIRMEGTDRLVAVADQRFFRATGQYDVGFGRDITDEVAWRTSDDAGTIDAHGVFVGARAGFVQVWAELDGQQSERIGLEVYATSELAYCDPLRINRNTWEDAFNRVILESSCSSYVSPEPVELRYTVTETQPHGGVFDPCLDLYVYQGDRRVRTIREEGCGDPFIAAGAPGRDEAVLKYQLRATWDLKDDTGALVAPGTYTVYGRFYLYYDPVVRLDVTILPPGSTPPTPEPTPSPSPAPQIKVQIGTEHGAPGAIATLPIIVSVGAAGPLRLRYDVVFDPRVPVAAAENGLPDCAADGAAGGVQPSYTFLPDGCGAAAACTGVRVDLTLAGESPAAGRTVKHECRLVVPGTTSAGTYPVRCGDAVATGAQGVPLEVGCADGAVEVGDAGAPPPMPEPIEGSCFLGSSLCAGSSFATSRQTCCKLSRQAGTPVAMSWCEGQQMGATGAGCAACAKDPCEAMVSSGPSTSH